MLPWQDKIIRDVFGTVKEDDYRQYNTAYKERAGDHHLYHLPHDEPHGEMTSFVFRETLMGHLLLWGNAYAQVIRDGRGNVIGLYPLLPGHMEVGHTKESNLYYRYLKDGRGSKNAHKVAVLEEGMQVKTLRLRFYCSWWMV